MTKSDKWKKRPVVERYFDYCDELRIISQQKGYEITKHLSLTFVVPFPKSYTKKSKKELIGVSHEIKPDLDNYIKAFQDAMLSEDSSIHTYGFMSKVWGHKGQIIVWDINEKNYEINYPLFGQ